MKINFTKEDKDRVIKKFDKIKYLREFVKSGKIKYKKMAQDDLKHIIELDLRISRGMFMKISPILKVDHDEIGEILHYSMSLDRKYARSITVDSLWNICRNEMMDRKGLEYNYILDIPNIENIAEQNLKRRADSLSNDFYKKNDGVPVLSGWLDLDALIRRIDQDLSTAGVRYFADRDTIPKVLYCLETDSWAGGTSRRIKIMCLYYIQGRYDDILDIVSTWDKKNAAIMELRFADGIKKKIEQDRQSNK